MALTHEMASAAHSLWQSHLGWMEAIMTRITQLIVGVSVVGVIAIGSAVAQSA
jgi:hypothetical protein